MFGEFYKVLDDFFSDRVSMRRSLTGDTFKVDIQEDEDNYIVTEELSGVKKKKSI